MLITQNEIRGAFITHNIRINGVLHIGAHECEELSLYENLGVNTDNMIWIDGNKDKVRESQNRGIKNVYYAVITDKDNDEVEFKITNNGQSSSILDFGSHSKHHPHVYFVETQKHKTVTIDTFYQNNNLFPLLYLEGIRFSSILILPLVVKKHPRFRRLTLEEMM